MKYFEHPLEFLRRKKTLEGDTSVFFEETIVANWYKARAFVLNKLSTLSLRPEEDAHLHFIVKDDSELMLFIIRQIALTAHFVNFDDANEEKRDNRTIITLVSRKKDILFQLMKEELLCNLLDYCKLSYYGCIRNSNSYLDIEIRIVDQWEQTEKDYTEIKCGKHIEKRIEIKKSDVEDFCAERSGIELFSIDTRKAQYVNRMYKLGCEIDNIPYEDIHNVKRYSMALDVFQYIRLSEYMGTMVNESLWSQEENQAEVLRCISSIFCADCFMLRYNSIRPCCDDSRMSEKETWEKYYDALSKSEHSRWVVEKLILGYRPFSTQERLKDEILSIDKYKRAQYRNNQKKNWKSPKHLNLCSFSDLRRIDPDAMKYDSYLMLGIPEILRKVGEISNK